MGNEVNAGQSLSNDINVITAEINAYQRVAGEAIFEIGYRLKGVRDNPQDYGFEGYRDWEKWCSEQLDMTRQHANRFIKVFERFGEKKLGTPEFPKIESITTLASLAVFADEELTEPREMPDGSTKTLLEMSRREIEEFKREMKKAQERADKAEQAAEQAQRMTEQERQRAQQESDKRRQAEQQLASATNPKEIVVEKEVEKVVEIDKTDYSAVERLRAYEERFGALENYSDRVRATNVSDTTTAIVSFNMAVRDFIKRHAFLIKYNDTIQYVDQVTRREYNEAVQALKEISADFSKVTGIGDFVDAEFTEVQQ